MDKFKEYLKKRKQHLEQRLNMELDEYIRAKVISQFNEIVNVINMYENRELL